MTAAPPDKPPAPGQQAGTAILVHSPVNHPVYLRITAVAVLREATAEDAANGAKCSVHVDGVNIPLQETYQTLLTLLGWP